MPSLAVIVIGFTLNICAAPEPVQAQQGYAAQVVAGEADLRNWLRSFETYGAKVSSSDITSNLLKNEVSVKNLAISMMPDDLSGNAMEIYIDELTVSGFTAQSGQYRFDDAEIDGLKVQNPTGFAQFLSIKHFSMGKSLIPAVAMFKADPQRPVTAQINFLKFLSGISIENAEIIELAVSSGFRMGRANLTGIADGKLALLEAVAVAQDGAATDVAPGVGRIERDGVSISALELKNANVKGYIDIFDDGAYLAAGTKRPWSNLAELLRMEGVAFRKGHVSGSVKEISTGTLKVRQFPRSITEIFDMASHDATYLQNNPADASMLAEYVQQSFMIERAQVGDVTIISRDAKGQAKAAVESAVISNLSAKHLDRIELKSGTISDSSGYFKLGSAAIADINVAQVGMVATSGGPSTPYDNLAIPTIGSLQLNDIEARVDEVILGLQQLDVRLSYFIGATPTNFKVSISHLKSSVAQITAPGLRQLLSDFGYANIDLSLELKGSWQDSASAIFIDTFKVSSIDMGTLTLSGLLTGISRKGIEYPLTELPREIMAGGVQNFSLSFKNDTLFERFLSQVAKSNNKTLDEIRKLLSGNMPYLMDRISTPIIRNRFIFAAVSFVNNPKVLELVTKTSQIVPVDEIASALPDPYKLPVILNLDASAHDRK